MALYIRRFKEAQTQFDSPRPPDTPSPTWLPPMGEVIKFNFDGSINRQGLFAGLGIVGRDSIGAVKAWRRRRVPHI